MKILQEIHLTMKRQMVQGPTGDDDEIKLWKAWMMEMLKNEGNISMTTMNGSEQASEDYNKFLYARVTHSNCQYSIICKK